MMENHSFADIVGNRNAPYFNSLIRGGLSLTNFYAVTHPSQPNYIAVFSGSTHHVVNDSCPHTIHAANLASELLSSGHTFASYSEGLPKAGSTACFAGRYARKHAPWTDFPDLPAHLQRPFTDFPSDYRRLPTLSFVIPDLDHDMHDGTIHSADQWLQRQVGSYARWARLHNSLLVVTWDEDDHSQQNQIPTFITGAGVRAGSTYRHRSNLYGLLRTFESMYRLPPLGESAAATAIPVR